MLGVARHKFAVYVSAHQVEEEWSAWARMLEKRRVDRRGESLG